MSSRGLRHTPFHRVLYRSNLLFGCDRELVLISLLLTCGIPLASINFFSMLISITFSLGIVSLLRLMAKSDPEMRKVYWRHIHYQDYYPARSTPFCEW